MYMPVTYVFALDGAEIFSKSDHSGKLADQKEFEVFNGAIVPGNHTLSVELIYQGNGYGVFSYLKGYKFTARSSHTFTVAEGKQLQLKVVGFEKGNPVTTHPEGPARGRLPRDGSLRQGHGRQAAARGEEVAR